MNRFFSIVLLLTAFTVHAGNPLKNCDNLISTNESIESEVREMLLVVKSNKAGSVAEQTVFLKKLTPHLKKTKKLLKKNGKLSGKLLKSAAKKGLSQEFPKKIITSNQTMLNYVTQAVLPAAGETDFLAKFQKAVKDVMKMTAVIKEQNTLIATFKKEIAEHEN